GAAAAGAGGAEAVARALDRSCELPIMPLQNAQAIVERLKEFQREVRHALLRSRASQAVDASQVRRDSTADTIYQIDTLVEPLLEAFCEEWAKQTPLVVVAEGLENERGEEGSRVFPQG